MPRMIELIKNNLPATLLLSEAEIALLFDVCALNNAVIYADSITEDKYPKGKFVIFSNVKKLSSISTPLNNTLIYIYIIYIYFNNVVF